MGMLAAMKCLAVAAPLVPGKSGNWMKLNIEDCYGARKRKESDCLHGASKTHQAAGLLLGEAL